MGSEVQRMESNQARLADVMRGSQSKLIDRWTEILSSAVSHGISAPELRRELEELFVLIVRSMPGQDESAAGELQAVLAEMSRDRARRGFSPRETALGVFSLKDAVYELVAGSEELVTDYIVFARHIDDLGLYTFETFASAREQVIADQAESMLELSTPVVRLWHGIIAVPLVGTLDSARTQLVMEKMLDALVATEAEHAVIDITGVPTVDTEVAQHLLKTVVAARLMGAECIITGIRPQIAHTIVSLGIEFGDVPTMQTLADGLKHALRKSGLKVVQA
jgi:rsbT co-antagonist protein RsbR